MFVSYVYASSTVSLYQSQQVEARVVFTFNILSLFYIFVFNDKVSVFIKFVERYAKIVEIGAREFRRKADKRLGSRNAPPTPRSPWLAVVKGFGPRTGRSGS